MNPRNLLAVFLILIGIVAFAYQGITLTTQEKVVDLGSVQVTTEKQRTLPLPPVVGAVAIVAGLALLFLTRSKG